MEDEDGKSRQCEIQCSLFKVTGGQNVLVCVSWADDQRRKTDVRLINSIKLIHIRLYRRTKS